MTLNPSWPSFRAYEKPARPWRNAIGSSKEVIEGWIALKLRFGFSSSVERDFHFDGSFHTPTAPAPE